MGVAVGVGVNVAVEVGVAVLVGVGVGVADIVGVAVGVAVTVGVTSWLLRYVTTSFGRWLTVPFCALAKRKDAVDVEDAPRSRSPLFSRLPWRQARTKLVTSKLYHR